MKQKKLKQKLRNLHKQQREIIENQMKIINLLTSANAPLIYEKKTSRNPLQHWRNMPRAI